MADADDPRPDHIRGFSYAIDGPFVRIVATGTPTARDFDRLLHAITADPRYRRGMPILHDRRAATTPTTDYAHQVAAILSAHAKRMGPCRWAVIVGNHDRGLAYGMSRMISALHEASSVTSRPFTDEDDAREWLRSGGDGPDGVDSF